MARCWDESRCGVLGFLVKFLVFRSNMKVLTSIVLCFVLPHVNLAAENSCYDSQGRAQKCVPEFVNAAFNLTVEATNTCGLTGPQEYCLQTGVTGVRKSCGHICDAGSPYQRHPSSFMTDFNNQNNWTWWQSETMLERRSEWLSTRQQHVNLTLRLGKAFDITYIRLRFHSPRPESFAIYKRTSEDSNWIPYQFYSMSCDSTYKMPFRNIVLADKQDVATCTDEYSDISPLTGGEVPFSTLEGRPDAENFENSKVLQNWVTATDIRIVLTRMNTFGDEIFGDPRVLRTYFYAIDDLAVGARCKCNGHARSCEIAPNRQMICNCEHNTMGPDCNMCRPFYNDRPWARATELDGMECLPCDCGGFSNECYFDEELYRTTGHGGHCTNCADNRGGVNCQECLPNHYVDARTNRCTPCNCDETGSEDLQCDSNGQCLCKPGVTGQRCDRCEDNFYDFSVYGCRPCGCVVEGSKDNYPSCDSSTGACVCKEFVEGQNCDRCKLGYFGLDEENPYGCISCFCYGHSSICSNATGYFPRTISTDFETGKQGWTGTDRSNQVIETQYNGILQNLGISAPDNNDIVYFSAPARYLGDQRFSYNQFLTYKLRIGEEDAAASIADILIEGAGQRISAPYYSQGNPRPGIEVEEYKFRLNEHPDYRWYPQLNSEAFISILANITAIKIRATYNPAGVGFIDDINLETARRGFDGDEEADWVESCTCPEGYVGQFCESCAPGYKREPAYGGPFASCVPCECNGHGDLCDAESGRCICGDNTEGDYCEKCAVGYYGDATEGTPDDCKPCPCPGQGPCIQLRVGEIVCTACDQGYGGNLCDICLDGYFGDPKGWYGEERPCMKCDCNENIDPNAVGNCNRTSGECKKCKYNTAGPNCEKCLPNFYGDALALPKGDCKACNCYPPGTVRAGLIQCDPTSGDCPCQPNVKGRQCDQCEVGYWNLDSGQGCEACDCDPIGSINSTVCDLVSGQCECKPGVTGRKCDMCQQLYYGFSVVGCTACNCDPEGSKDLQCDGDSGRCDCIEGVEGHRCDRCEENKYNITAGCIDCPPCYSLVQERVNIHRGKLRELNNLILNIGNNPSAFNDTQFLSQLTMVNDSVSELLNDAKGASSGNGTMVQQLAKLKEYIMDVLNRCGQITSNILTAKTTAESSMDDIMKAEEAIKRAEDALKAAENYIDTEGQSALQRAKDALDKFGQQSKQMTSIATEAKMLSTSQLDEAERIRMLSEKALETSNEALRLAIETLQMPGNILLDIQELRNKVEEAQRLYDSTKFFAQKALNMSMEAYDEALALYSEATNVDIPAVEIERLMEESKRIKEEAADIKAEAEFLMEQNQVLLDDVAEQRIEAQDTLNSGIKHQQRADELLAEVDAAEARALNAVLMGEKTLQEANQTLQTLLDFNEMVQNSRGKAEDALKKVPDIEDSIAEAERKTEEARNALSGAENDANDALSIAEMAEKTAQDASDEASRIRQEAEKTKQKAVNLKDDADLLAEDVNDSEEQIKNLNIQAETDSDLAEEALERAGQAKQTAKDAADKVAAALANVQNISNILANLRDIDTDEIDRLEADLAAAQQTLEDADLESEFTKLTTANDEVKKWVQEYRMDLTDLEADVQNVKDIMESLPDGCFKNIDIESPTSQ